MGYFDSRIFEGDAERLQHRVSELNAKPHMTANERDECLSLLGQIHALEGAAGIETMLKAAPDLRLAFGSHSPYFYFEAALLKLQESPLTAEQLTAIRSGHARAALAHTR